MKLHKDKKHKVIKKVIFGFIIVALMFISFAAGSFSAVKYDIIQDTIRQESVYLGELTGQYSEVPEGKIGQDIDFNLFWQAWDTIKEEYVDRDTLLDKTMFYGAIRGMVASLEDPYTVFMNPQIAKDFSDDLAGAFEGIGAEIGIKNDILTIIAPLPDMPAEQVGLKAGDKVLAIDGESTIGISIDAAVNKIRGPKDSEVVLSVVRDDFEEMKDFAITRGRIVVKSIRTEMRDDDIFVITITNFNEDTEDLFNRAVRRVIEEDPAGVILDLRNNPGGFLDTAIEVSSEWIEDGLVVSEKYSEDNIVPHHSRGRARLKAYPTVVLVNEGSASASEIVSGALQDYKLAVIIGKKTFGKGSVQTLTNLEDGSSLKITVAKWITPNGRSINDEGIMPDEVAEYTREDYENSIDPQFDKAIEVLTGVKVEHPELIASSTDDISTSTDK